MRLAATDRQYKVGVEWKRDRLKLKRLEKTAVDEFEKGVGMLARVDGTADGALRAFGGFGAFGVHLGEKIGVMIPIIEL